MLRLVLVVVVLSIVCASSAFAVYDDVTVASVTQNSTQDTVTIVANFSGSGEAVTQRSIVFPWNYTDVALTEWSVSTLEKLNGLKGIGDRVKAADKLPTVRPIVEIIP